MKNKQESLSGSNYLAPNGDINITHQSRNISSNLSEIINILGKPITDNEESKKGTIGVIEPDQKIAYNNVVRFKSQIDEHKLYVGKLISIYSVFDKEGTNKTYNTLTNIKHHYLKVREEYQSKYIHRNLIDVIRENADNIIEDVEARLLKEITNSSNITEGWDSINVNLQVIMIDAFMRCKILEEPIKNAATK